MATLIDASVLVAIERQQLDLDTLRAEHAEEEAALAAITASEFCIAPRPHSSARAGRHLSNRLLPTRRWSPLI